MDADSSQVTVTLSGWAHRQLVAAARREGRSPEEEAGGRLERSLQNRRGTDAMEEFLRLAQGSVDAGAEGMRAPARP